MKTITSTTIRALGAAGVTAAAVLASATPGFAAAATDGGLVANYDFSAGAAGTFIAGSSGIPSWSVGGVGVDVYAPSVFAPPTGTPTANAVDLAGSQGDDSRGAVSQLLTGLTAEMQYIVSYQASAHKCPEDTSDRLVKEAHVDINGVLVPQADGDGSLDINTASGTDAAGKTAWTDRSFVFNTAEGQTTANLAFIGDSLGGCGVLITDVSVASVGAAPLLDPVIVGSSLAAAGLVGFGVYTVRRRRTQGA